MRYLVLSFLLATGLSAIAQQRMTPELLWSLKRVAADAISDDGKYLYYTSRQVDWKTEKSTAKHYRLDLSTGKRGVSKIQEDRAIFQREGNSWYATTGTKIYSTKDAAQTWEEVLESEGMENIKVSPDGRYVAFSKEVLVKPMLGTDMYKDLPKTKTQVYTDLNYRHWDTWEDGKFSHIFIADTKNGTVKDIMLDEPYDCPQKPFGGAEDFVWSADGKALLYVCKKKFGKEYAVSTNTDLFWYDIVSGETINRTQGMMGYDMAPAFSPDGKRLAWTSMKRDGYEADKNDIYVMDIQTGRNVKMNLTAGWNGTVDGFVWSSDGKSIFFNAPLRGTVQLFEVQVPSNLMVRMMPLIDRVTNGKFDVAGIVGQAGKEVIVSRTDMNHAAELYAVNIKDGRMRQLTYENNDVYGSLKLSKTQLRMVKTTDDKEMGVWVIYPPGFDPSKKYPTLLYCQGGPQSPLTQFYSVRWNFQLMAAQGYIVVAPNRRGMAGWGTEWNEDISKDWGGQPMRDYLAAIDDVSKESYVDKNRLGCVGASYGGYSVFMLAGMHDNRFKSFIAHDGLFDLTSWYGTTEELWSANWDIGGPYWDKNKSKSYEKYNPINFVHKWSTPIMIIQGGLDYRVPVEQGLEAFQAAQLHGIKSKLLYIPNENHWVLHAHNGIAWQREFFKWLDETLK